MTNSLKELPAGDVLPTASTTAPFRHGALCALWTLLLLATLVPVVVAKPNEARLIALLAAIYVGQALLAEILGVRVGHETIVAPRRWGPFSSLWRRRLEIQSVKSILAKPKSAWGEQVLLQPLSGSRLLLLFQSRDQKLAFLKVVSTRDRRVSIYRAD
ncbi:hypothetical protein [Methylocystis heyeri]|uniref:PH domain-containing protein n=1 Tax=Methylocystis heyeri TaxID=391905 RepID=A0A6B8KGB2_9HYPH|nr:hypothetical protein [Methylocystis heyeri]QGM46015.1 hypothetical protein H2LOC_010040 [Methylocystis heyeri]